MGPHFHCHRSAEILNSSDHEKILLEKRIFDFVRNQFLSDYADCGINLLEYVLFYFGQELKPFIYLGLGKYSNFDLKDQFCYQKETNNLN